MSATDRVRTGFRQAQVPYRAPLNQIFHRAGHILDRHARINPMLVEQVDALDLQSLEHRLDHRTDVLGPAVEPLPSAVRANQPNLWRSPPVVPGGALRRPVLVVERTVDLGRIEQCHATLDCRADEAIICCLSGRAVAGARPCSQGRAETQVALARCTCLHYRLLRRPIWHADLAPSRRSLVSYMSLAEVRRGRTR
jgi:hypothetical protein